MKHNANMYTYLKQREKLFDGLITCLKDEDQNVRKVTHYSVTARLSNVQVDS